MKHIVLDQMSRKVALPAAFPERIISLVPSQTELLFDLGLDEQVIGVTKFCIHPKEKVKKKAKIGGTKKFHLDKIADLKPDMIIGNKEENYKEGIEALENTFPVWMSDIFTLEDAYEMILSIGSITGRSEKAAEIVNKIKKSFDDLVPLKGASCLYFIWQKPFMAVGGNTFINHMLEKVGFENKLKTEKRYPELAVEDIQELNPDVILLSSEPYPFKEKHIAEFKEICPSANVLVVDGEMFSWYGSRLLYAVSYFTELQKQVASLLRG